MIESLSLAGLVILMLVLIILPMLPAGVELHERSDIIPLRVSKSYEATTPHLAYAFRDYLRQQLGTLPPPRGPHPTSLPNGAAVMLLSNTTDEYSASSPAARKGVAPIIIASRAVSVPSRSELIGDIYAAWSFEGGEDSVYRALFAEEDTTIGARSVVLRWIHSQKKLSVGDGSQLYGRTTADERIELGTGVRFERVYSPSIGFGERRSPPARRNGRTGVDLSQKTALLKGLTFVREDLEIPADSVVDGDIVVRGTLIIGQGSVILGSVKGYEAVRLLDGVHVAGALVTDREVTVGRDCFVQGPIISEHAAYIGAGSEIGRIGALATITARHIYVEPGALIHGTLWPRKLGLVTPLEMGDPVPAQTPGRATAIETP